MLAAVDESLRRDDAVRTNEHCIGKLGHLKGPPDFGRIRDALELNAVALGHLTLLLRIAIADEEQSQTLALSKGFDGGEQRLADRTGWRNEEQQPQRTRRHRAADFHRATGEGAHREPRGGFAGLWPAAQR